MNCKAPAPTVTKSELIGIELVCGEDKRGGFPGAQKRGTWGTQMWWRNRHTQEPGHRPGHLSDRKYLNNQSAAGVDGVIREESEMEKGPSFTDLGLNLPSSLSLCVPRKF